MVEGQGGCVLTPRRRERELRKAGMGLGQVRKVRQGYTREPRTVNTEPGTPSPVSPCSPFALVKQSHPLRLCGLRVSLWLSSPFPNIFRLLLVAPDDERHLLTALLFPLALSGK